MVSEFYVRCSSSLQVDANTSSFEFDSALNFSADNANQNMPIRNYISSIPQSLSDVQNTFHQRSALRKAYRDFKAGGYALNVQVNRNTLKRIHERAEEAFKRLDETGNIRDKDQRRFDAIDNKNTLYSLTDPASPTNTHRSQSPSRSFRSSELLADDPRYTQVKW